MSSANSISALCKISDSKEERMAVAESIHSTSPSLHGCHSFTNPLKETNQWLWPPRDTDRQAEAVALQTAATNNSRNESVTHLSALLKASNTATSANLKDVCAVYIKQNSNLSFP